MVTLGVTRPIRCSVCGGTIQPGETALAEDLFSPRFHADPQRCITAPVSHHASGDMGLAKLFGLWEFKPDAEAAPAGATCARCGRRDGVAWIAGAGEVLCYRHQDDY